ncbi:fam-a protein [Plasmodium vinckei petteri]|uniref:Fam-a protein n=1 Tax=Plasmodium vinckei petteri TaxID=138298 RepID=A0A6V7SFZ6_PLAVN|nr:fam-a protein [Plasmodium vinckei petteri]
MNKGYIKIVLALLCVAGYMQNVVFASEYDPSTNFSNEESKQLLTADPEEVQQQLFIDPEEIQKQLSINPEEIQQQLSTESEEDKQHESTESEEDKQQVSIESEENKQQESTESEENKQQESTESDENKQQESTESEENKQQESTESEENKHQVSIESEENKQASTESEENKQQESIESEEDKQQVSTESEENKQQESIESEEDKQQVSIESEENKQQESLKLKEANQAENIMAKALALAQEHAKHTKDYKLYSNKNGATLHFKRVNNVDIGKLEVTIPNPDSYTDIVNMLWYPNGAKSYNHLFDKGYLPKIYNPNLVIVQQRYRNPNKTWKTYCHALASKSQLSEDETAIVLTSSHMNDHDSKNTKIYLNPIVKSANTFNPEIDSEEDIRNGQLSKTYINLLAFIIKKEADCVKITHVSSVSNIENLVDHNVPFRIPQELLRGVTAATMSNITKLRDIFKKE